MKKTLVIVAHPHIENSIINKRWIDELKRYPQHFTVHQLYQAYPNELINVEQEQQLVEGHDNLVFQFPFYWFSCTPLLKKWFDEVLTYGWAYGSQATKLIDKKIALAISLGSKEEEYQPPYSLTNLLLPIETTIKYINADYQGVFTLYGAHTDLSKNQINQNEIDENAQQYIKFLMSLIK